MIEKEGILLHLDSKGDRVGDADFEFTGWVVSDRPVAAVWLPAVGPGRLTTNDRPDVCRVFPGRLALGFSGKSKSGKIGPGGLQIAVQLGSEVVEITHPVAAPLPELPILQRFAVWFQIAWLRFRESLARNSSARFAYTLRRHLLARRLRGGIFRRSHTEALLADFASAVPNAFFLQIGANDGYTGDPLHSLITRRDTYWRGVLVEPVAHLFVQLSQRYNHYPALQLVQAAIGEKDGTTWIHRVATQPTDSLWLDQIPSLDPALLERTAGQFGKGLRESISEEVRLLSVPTLLSKHAITHLDLLVVDTEGWDWRILRQFDLSCLRPALILYEHQHLPREDQEAARRFLADQSYESVATEEGDTLAWRLPG